MSTPEEVLRYNRDAWDRQVERHNRWTVAVGREEVERARRGDLQVVLTPSRPVPMDWFPPLSGLDVLCLASGGGQQGPLLAAAGASVTVYDNSPRQLDQDRMVADREGLTLECVQGDMADLSALRDASFDLIFHPCSNGFVPDVRPVWREAYRVLCPGGVLLAGFTNPLVYLFDETAMDQGELRVAHSIPYSDLTSLNEEERKRLVERDEPMCFGHTLDDQIGGQLAAGFVLTGFYEDGDPTSPLSRYIPAYIATRALKPGT